MPNAALDASASGDTQNDGVSRIDFTANDVGGAGNARDETADDIEEFLLFAGGTQQVTTTRSDVFVAYILVHGYRDADNNGDFNSTDDDGLIEQSRSIVLFDRSKLVDNGDTVESRVLYTFPQ